MTKSCLACSSEAKKEAISSLGDDYDIVECPDCRIAYLDPIPSLDVLNKFYNAEENVEHYVRTAEKKLKSGRRRVKDLLKYCPAKGDFLDVGCSSGANVEAARRLGFTATGIDLSQTAINVARDKFPENRYEYMTSQDLAKEGKEYDIVYSTDVIEHISDIHSFVESLRQLTKIGGTLYITTPDAKHFRTPKNLAKWKHAHAPDHICYFNREIFERVLNEHGIEIIKFKWTWKTAIRAVARRVS